MDHMEFSIALPPPMELTNAGAEWASMKQRLATHGCHISDVHRQRDGLSKAFLINIAADQVQGIFNMFALSCDEVLKFSTILQHLEDVCIPRLIIIYNRYKFFTCTQMYGDKFDNFLRDLLNWSENCEFGDLKDILLKDCIITGIPDNSIRQRLLETEALDFTKTVEICRAVEKWQRVRSVHACTNQIKFCDACVGTENSENLLSDCGQVIGQSLSESNQITEQSLSVGEQILRESYCEEKQIAGRFYSEKVYTEKPLKEDVDVIMDSKTQNATGSFTQKKCYQLTAQNIGDNLKLNFNLQAQENISSVDLFHSSSSSQNKDKCLINSEVESSADREIGSLKVFRRSMRNKKGADFSGTDHGKLNTANQKTEKRSCPSKKLKILKSNCETDRDLNMKSESKTSDDEEIKDAKVRKVKDHKSEMHNGKNQAEVVHHGNQPMVLKLRRAKGDEPVEVNIVEKVKIPLRNTCRSNNGNGEIEEFEKELLCSFCGHSFTNKALLFSHVQKTHGKKNLCKIHLKCMVCYAAFMDQTALKKHRLIHEKVKKFKCSICSTEFGSPSHLKVHMRLHTGERPYTCETCGASYPEASKLKAHIRKHTGEKPYRCSVCGRTFAWTAAFSRHMRTHTGEKPYTCEKCGVNFADFTSLQRHIRTHTLEKPYHCDKCNANFTDPSALKVHIRIHNGERPYICVTCGTAFIRSQHLKEHSKLHTGEKPFKCETCGAKFSGASKLKSHCRKHTGEKPYLCKICGSRFAWTAAFTRHMRTHTMEKPYICDFCGSHYADHSTLTRHRRTHTGEQPYLCKTCGRHFADNSSLHRHMRIHTGEKLYTCEVCGSSFAVKSYLVRHMRTHTGEKPYGCDLCNSKFTDSSKLNRHRKTHFKSETKQEKQRKLEEPMYQQLQPIQFSSHEADLHQEQMNLKLDSQKSGQQQTLSSSVIQNLQHSIMLTPALLPLNSGLPFVS